MSVEAFQVRLDEHARRLADLERTQPAVIANDVAALRRDIHELSEDVRALKRAWWAVSLSVAGGGIAVAFTAFQVWGGSP